MRLALSLFLSFTASVVVLLVHPVSAHAANPNALWHIVHDECVPDRQQHGNPSPCREVDLQHGFAILKDINGASQFLLIPTARVTGVESPQLESPGAPNYWADAWGARRLVGQALGVADIAPEQVGVAINSIYARSQLQLHIHIDCVDPQVAAALARHRDDPPRTWSTLRLKGHDYRVMRLDEAELGSDNPFDIVASTLPGARQRMGRQGILVTGMRSNGRQGFYIVDGQANLLTLNRGSAEDLLDHRCTALAPGAAAILP